VAAPRTSRAARSHQWIIKHFVFLRRLGGSDAVVEFLDYSRNRQAAPDANGVYLR
jgi:hypothetical protein